MIYVFVLNQTLEGHVIPYLKEVRLADNLLGQLKGTYVRCCIFTCVRAIPESTPHVGCTQVMSLFRLAMSNFTLRGQLRCHQVVVHSQARNKIFYCSCSACAMAHASFLKFKSSCTICRAEPNMLKNLPIIPSRTSQNFDLLFLFYAHIITYYSYT